MLDFKKKKCVYLPIQTAEEEMEIEGRATGAATNPDKSFNCFCDHLGVLSLASQMLLLPPADLHFGKEERVLRGHDIFSFPNVGLKCMVCSQLSSEGNLPGFPSCLGTTILPSLVLKRFL